MRVVAGLKVMLWLYTVALRNTSDSMMVSCHVCQNHPAPPVFLGGTGIQTPYLQFQNSLI